MFALMSGLFLQAAGADAETTQQLVDALLQITGLSLAQHAIAAAAVVMVVGMIQQKFLADKGWSKFTPLVAIALGILYFFTPLAGLEPSADGAAIEPMSRVIYGIVFGIAVIGGRSTIKNVKGDYDEE